MGLLEQCREAFGAGDLYQVLGVPRGASAEEIRRGYHKASLRVHPDRAEPAEKERATCHFQILGKVYAVLSDQEQRTLYDQQGVVDEESTVLSEDRNWEEYWKMIFKEVTLKDIEDFKKQYSDSTEEAEDIKTAYKNCKGNMDNIMTKVLCADYTDEPRIREIIQQAIDSGELPFYKAFAKESKQKMNARKRRAEKEAKEAEKAKEELGLHKDDDVKTLIQRRNENRKKEMDDFLAQMEAKYGNTSKKGGKKPSAKKGIK
ncbi:dnaJ homolog subfamily C member 9 [Eublepharis macularius]|uniref:DnaJ homolog subfamily C member 9 n=1 Tax=Eublepharis macularius TaxID=481883 RepID=A0AA97L4D6_EUBMA|nr:dnaJ homolog subfamily C member 9 [Eublepharis macularius]